MNVDKEISLQDEIQICLDYLSIMQLRYEDKLMVVSGDRNLLIKKVKNAMDTITQAVVSSMVFCIFSRIGFLPGLSLHHAAAL